MKFLAVSCIVALACGVAGEAPGETSGTAKEPPIGVAVCGGGMRAMTEGMAIARGIGPENWPRVTHLGGASGGYWFGTQFVSRCGLSPRAASRARLLASRGRSAPQSPHRHRPRASGRSGPCSRRWFRLQAAGRFEGPAARRREERPRRAVSPRWRPNAANPSPPKPSRGQEADNKSRWRGGSGPPRRATSTG